MLPACVLTGDYVMDANAAIIRSECVTWAVSIAETLRRDFWCEPVPMEVRSWRPLPVLLWRMLFALGGGSAPAWCCHLLSLIAHAIVTALVMTSGRRLGLSESAARWGGLCFAVLAIHTDLVSSMVGLGGLCSAALSLGAVVRFLGVRDRRPWITPLLVGLAISSHESGVLAVALMLIVLGTHRRASSMNVQRTRSVEVVTSMTVAGLMLAYRAHVIDGWSTSDVPFDVNPLVHLALPDRILDGLGLIGRYLTLAITGFPLAVDYAFDAIPLGAARDWSLTALGAGYIGGCLGLAARFRRSPPTVVLALSAAGSALFVSNIVLALPAIFAERMFYLGSIPLCLGLGGLLARVHPRQAPWRLALTVLAVSWLTVQAVSTVVHAWTWRDDLALYQRSAEAVPRNARLRSWAANAAIRRGDPELAIHHAVSSLEIQPGEARPHAYLGVALDLTGRPEDALRSFRRAFELAPSDGESVDLFIQFLRSYGHLEQARLIFERHRQARGGTADPLVQRPDSP